MGRGQAVRQRVLVPLLGGSNPSVPEQTNSIRIKIVFFNNFMFSEVIYLEKLYVPYLFDISMMHSESKCERKASLFPTPKVTVT